MQCSWNVIFVSEFHAAYALPRAVSSVRSRFVTLLGKKLFTLDMALKYVIMHTWVEKFRDFVFLRSPGRLSDPVRCPRGCETFFYVEKYLEIPEDLSCRYFWLWSNLEGGKSFNCEIFVEGGGKLAKKILGGWRRVLFLNRRAKRDFSSPQKFLGEILIFWYF